MKKTLSQNPAILSIMRLIFISLIIPAYLTGICHGQEHQEQEDITTGDWFIVPGKEIPVRTGMGQEYRILAMAPSGTRVEALEQTDIWVKVKLQDRQTGWMPFRYLTRTH
ncbi:MAG: SH3 domain-containing protein, partial [Desulfobulbaceae bacterium]|nr:SH3 domain-containing protein [Desulfobulbaceae bacterium]